jgi:hypothetical protein
MEVAWRVVAAASSSTNVPGRATPYGFLGMFVRAAHHKARGMSKASCLFQNEHLLPDDESSIGRQLFSGK